MATEIIVKNFTSITAKIKSVVLVESDPYLELFEYTKTIKTKKVLSNYAVKVLSKIIVEGTPQFKDENYSDDTNFYEEQILLFRVESSDIAFKKAEQYMKEQIEYPPYENIYGQTVRMEILEYITCYELFEKPTNENPEVFSNIYCAPKEISDEQILINRYDYFIKDEEQSKYDQWETLKRKVILNALFQKKKQ